MIFMETKVLGSIWTQQIVISLPITISLRMIGLEFNFQEHPVRILLLVIASIITGGVLVLV
jgi:hypothetical protein